MIFCIFDSSQLWDSITLPFRKAFSWVKRQFGIAESDTSSFTDDLKAIFSKIWDFITAPFQRAFKFVEDLYDTATDDNLTFTEKLKKIFSLVLDYIFAPFKDAFIWVLKQFGVSQKDIDKGVKEIKNIFSKVFDFIKAPFQKAFDWVKSGWKGLMNFLGNEDVKTSINIDPRLANQAIGSGGMDNSRTYFGNTTSGSYNTTNNNYLGVPLGEINTMKKSLTNSTLRNFAPVSK